MRIMVKWLPIALWAGLAAGCGDYSNPQLQEDLEFLSAIPARETLELRIADSEPRPLGEDKADLTLRQDALIGQLAAFYVEGLKFTTAVNSGVLGFLELVDLITHRIPPTLRQADRRVWGPWPSEDDPGVDLRFEMRKLEPGLFELHFQMRPHELAETVGYDEGWVDCVTGSDLRPSGLFRRGSGDLLIDLGACAGVTGSGEQGTAGVHFETGPDAENPDGKTLVAVLFAGFLTRDGIADGEDPLNAMYHFAEWGDLAGEFDFTSQADINADPALTALETWQWKIRWTPDGCGRTDIQLSGGDLGQLTVEARECWNERHRRVYWSMPFPTPEEPVPEEGDPADCCLEPTPFD